MEPQAIPPYPHQRAGTAIVCGSAWSLLDDYAIASRLRPGAFVIAVNDAVKHIKPDAIFSMHYEKMGIWLRRCSELWDWRSVETHTASRVNKGKLAWIAGNGGSYVDYIWPIDRAGGSSGWEAGKVARRMGFDEVIYCGVQLDVGPYQDGWHGWNRKDHVQNYRKAVLDDADWHAGALAVSGWLSEVLGGLDQAA